MGEPERRIAALLMSARTAQQAEYVLVTKAVELDPDELVRELRIGQRYLERDGQVKAAALVDFYVSLVTELRPVLLATSSTRSEEPADAWQTTERRAYALIEQGELDAALDLARAVAEAPHSGYTIGRALGVQWQVAEAMHAAGRTHEGLRILYSIDLGSTRTREDEALDVAIRMRLHYVRGTMHAAVAEYELARSEFDLALTAADQLGDTSEQIGIQASLADVYSAAGRSRQAVRECRKTLSLTESRGARPETRALALNRLGEALRKAGAAEAARSCYHRALELTGDSEVDEPRQLRAVEAWIGLGDLAADAGEDREASEAYFQALVKSMSVNRDAWAYGMRLVASRIDRITGPEAGLLLKTAQIFRDAFADPDRYWNSHLPYRLLEAAQHASDGDADTAVAVLRTLRRESRHRPIDVGTRLTIDDRLARALIARGSQLDLQEAFAIAWQHRSELLRSIANREGGSPGDVPALVEHYRPSYELMIELLIDHGHEIDVPAESRPSDPGTTPDGGVELAFDLNEEFKAWTDSTLGPTGLSAEPASLRRLRDCLAADPDAFRCAFVSYFFGAKTTTVFVVHADTGRLAVFCSELSELRLKWAAERLRRTFDGDAQAFPPLAPLPARRPWKRGLGFFEELAPKLLPFLSVVDGRELLCVAADPVLQALPLAALPIPGSRDRAGSGNGLVLAHRHAVVQVTSVSALLRTAARPLAPGGVRMFVAGVAALEDDDPDRLEHDIDFIAPNVYADTTGVSGLDATREAVLAGLSASRIAHLSGHGWYDRVEPLDSGLFLAHDHQRPSKLPLTVEIRTRLKHLLTARHVLDMGLSLDLLTLRACSTARRDFHSTGDIQGLAHLLQSSGVQTVLGTLWDVDNTSSRRLFEAFYRRLADVPETPWKALWSAQRDMMEHPVDAWESHPYHWAAFVLFGDWRTR